jgi:hypothetical protein
VRRRRVAPQRPKRSVSEEADPQIYRRTPLDKSVLWVGFDSGETVREACAFGLLFVGDILHACFSVKPGLLLSNTAGKIDDSLDPA